MERQFILNPAVREQVPLFVGLVSPSGGGKTYSALRLAKGMKEVHGGPIILIDTENRRGLHYASEFDFLHMPFGAPYGSLDYLAAIREAAKHKPSAIIIDSMSHEHEGPGGLLDAHEKELDRMVGADAPQWKRDASSFAAWAGPKSSRRALLQGLTQTGANVIACFRAQEKVKPKKNDKGKMVPTSIGWQAITDPTFVYEMTVCALMPPGSNGVPNWAPEFPEEQAFIKLPGQFRNLFKPGEQLTEAHGRALAEWAAGGAAPAGGGEGLDLEALKTEGAHAATLGTSFLAAFWRRLSPAAKAALTEIKDSEWKPAAARADAEPETTTETHQAPALNPADY